MNPLQKLGSKKHPICVSVWDEENAANVAKVCDQHGWHFIARIAPEEDEDLEDLLVKLSYEQIKSEAFASLPATLLDPKPNNFCPCGSNKKYKKCCMLAGQRSDQASILEIHPRIENRVQ